MFEGLKSWWRKRFFPNDKFTLQVLSVLEHKKDLTFTEICGELGRSLAIGKVSHYLWRLKGKNFVYVGRGTDKANRYGLTPDGECFLQDLRLLYNNGDPTS